MVLFNKTTVLGYYGNYYYVSYPKNDGECRGFLNSFFVPSSIASDEIFKQLSTYQIVVFPGETSNEILTTNYKGTVKWSVYDDDIASFDKSTGKVTAKSPGTTIITATAGTKTLSCMVFSLSRWNDPETTITEKEIKVFDVPANNGKTIATLSKGTEIMADGDLENGLGWIHITSDNISGFIEVSDFPGIDYLMTEYHYYDEGFDTRYDSAHSKIESYTYILNEIMMDTFNLKVCSYVEPFTSSADRCKIWKYGSVLSDNLYAVCPKTGKHVADSCLLRSNMLSDLATKKGKGTKVIGRCLWTGHILENHEGSGATDKSNVIIFTTRNCTYGVGNQILDSSSTEIRDTRLYEIVHETGHLLGAVDGYCMGAENGGHCSNENCYECNEMAIPTCIMIQPFNPENSAVVFCDDCKSTINKHLKNHH